jgi:hypothetical protein
MFGSLASFSLLNSQLILVLFDDSPSSFRAFSAILLTGSRHCAPQNFHRIQQVIDNNIAMIQAVQSAARSSGIAVFSLLTANSGIL